MKSNWKILHIHVCRTIAILYTFKIYYKIYHCKTKIKSIETMARILNRHFGTSSTTQYALHEKKLINSGIYIYIYIYRMVNIAN